MSARGSIKRRGEFKKVANTVSGEMEWTHAGSFWCMGSYVMTGLSNAKFTPEEIEKYSDRPTKATHCSWRRLRRAVRPGTGEPAVSPCGLAAYYLIEFLRWAYWPY